MTKLFSDIETFLNGHQHGWCSVNKAHCLAATVLALRPLNCVELGVYAGRSAISIAMALKETGQGSLVAVDAWSKEVGIAAQVTPEDSAWWGSLDYEMIFKIFNDGLDATGTRQWVQTQRCASADAKLPDSIDLAHIDGGHGPDAVDDIEMIAPRMRGGGIIFVDDISWSGSHVARGVERLIDFGFIKLYNLDTGAVFQREAATNPYDNIDFELA